MSEHDKSLNEEDEASQARKEEIRRRFFSQRVDPSELLTLELLRSTYATLALTMDKILPEGREKEFAMSKLETSAMWATKAISHSKET